MIVYRLDYVNAKMNDSNELYFLGYFSTLDNTKKALKKYIEMPGFKEKPNQFEIKEYLSIEKENYSFLYDVNVYYHNEDYSIEHTTFLVVYYSKTKCVEVLEKYMSLNRKNKIFNELECETFINKHKLDNFNMSEGFITIEQPY